MAGNTTYSITEVVGTSSESIDDAIKSGIATASKSLRNLNWFEVTEIRGYIGDEDAPEYMQVTMKIGFRYEEDDD